jgi:hypothetical protein
MKLFLEEEISEEKDGVQETTTKVIKEVNDTAEAISKKTLNKCFVHTCYHDEGRNRPCTRRLI